MRKVNHDTTADYDVTAFVRKRFRYFWNDTYGIPDLIAINYQDENIAIVILRHSNYELHRLCLIDHPNCPLPFTDIELL
jgi:hypothetical protein